MSSHPLNVLSPHSHLKLNSMDQVEPVKSIPEGIPTFAMGDQQGSSDSEKGDQNSGSTSIGDEKIDETAAEDDYPDGGLRAWLIIVGVSVFRLSYSNWFDSRLLIGHMQRLCYVC